MTPWTQSQQQGKYIEDMATAAGPSPGPSRPQTPGRQLTPSGSGTGQTSTSGSLQDVSTGAKSELGGLVNIDALLVSTFSHEIGNPW